MPFAESGSLRLYHETAGSGPPVLLVSGQGMNRCAWRRTVPVLARWFQVISFDDRDTGRSDHTFWPYTTPQMADDAIAVLDAVGAERAHIYGMSLGGMVAQQIALRHPDRVGALILGSTTPGGLRVVLPDLKTLTFFVRAGWMGPEEAEWAAVQYRYGKATRRERGHLIADDIAHRGAFPVAPLAYLHQMAAAATHGTLGRLGTISAPTLVVHGEQDVVMPLANARRLADAIPDAELTVWPGAGHLYATDEPRADEEIARFLMCHSAALRRRPPERRQAPRLPAAINGSQVASRRFGIAAGPSSS